MTPRFSPNYHWSDLATCFRPSPENSIGALEKRFAVLSEHSSAVAFRYGRSGLYFLLKALGAKNKKVILPSYTCVVVAHAVVLTGNTPVFLDNAPHRLQPSPLDYLRAIDSQTAMVVPTHLFGIAEETSPLWKAIQEQHPSVFVLQDCAHSFFCREPNGHVVTRYGDGALFGMNISKLVNSVYGGMLTLRDSKLQLEVRKAFLAESKARTPWAQWKSRSYAASSALAFTPTGYDVVSWLSKNTSLLHSETQYFDPETIQLPEDFSAPMLPFEAGVGHQSLDRYSERVKRRLEIANAYIEGLAPLQGRPGVLVPPASQGNTWSHFPLLVPSEKRDQLRLGLEEKFGVEVGILVDYSVADLPAYQKRGAPSCPEALKAVKQVLNLPLTFQEGLTRRTNWKRTVVEMSQYLVENLP